MKSVLVRILALSLVFSAGCASVVRKPASLGPPRAELEVTGAWILKTPALPGGKARPIEASGLIRTPDGTWLTVGDKEEDTAIYSIHAGQGGPQEAEVRPYLDFGKLPEREQWRVQASLHPKSKVKGYNAQDIEGIAQCGDRFYLANERYREVWEIQKGQFSVLALELTRDNDIELWLGEANAGFEGIAVDCENGVLYLAKERGPAVIYQIDLKTGKTLNRSRFTSSPERSGIRAISPFNPADGLIDVGPSISDLAFKDGYLYVLERETYEIAKIDPKTLEVLRRVSFFGSEIIPRLPVRELYQTGEPFGLAEGLWLDGDRISIILDNNGNMLSTWGRIWFGGRDSQGAAWIEFRRPEGF